MQGVAGSIPATPILPCSSTDFSSPQGKEKIFREEEHMSSGRIAAIKDRELNEYCFA
jgi:hypothetical protein